MGVVFVSFAVTVISLMITWLALTNNPFVGLMTAIFGGTIFLALLMWGYNVNSHKNYQTIEKENREILGLPEISEKDKLEDDLALMCAIYNKIHVSYKDCAQRDAWLIVDKAERLGIELNMNTVDALFYDKLNSIHMNDYLHRAMAAYTSLDYIKIYG